MRFFNKIIFLAVSVILLTVFLGWRTEINTINGFVNDKGTLSVDTPPCVQLYHHILTYSEKYEVPQHIAFGVANHESGYKGPYHWKYNPKLSSPSNAYGAMQIQVPTANHFSDYRVTKDDLINNLELNVELSMRILSYLKKKYGTWELALGAYNTGRPIVNAYASRIVKFDTEKVFKYD